MCVRTCARVFVCMCGWGAGEQEGLSLWKGRCSSPEGMASWPSRDAARTAAGQCGEAVEVSEGGEPSGAERTLGASS